MEIIEQFPFNQNLGFNRKVFDYIKNLSCHGDIAQALTRSMKPCGDVQIYSPDIKHFRYVTVSTQKIIFGFGIGMDTIAFRLNKKMKAIAVQTGGKPFPECGDDWVSFEPFRCDWPRVDLEFWALKAYLNIRESVGLA